MRTFSIEKRADSPKVFIDELNNLVEIAGDSTLKETGWFYNNVLKWIIALNNNSAKKKTVNIKLRKVNTNSLKRLVILFSGIYRHLPSASLEINWYTEGNSHNAEALCGELLNKPGVIVNVR
jgi:hypothetical protein